MSNLHYQSQTLESVLRPANRLRLLSYNVQVGIGSHNYSDYLTQSWRHILPDFRRQENLAEVAHWLTHYDIVALQEVDAGSLRTHYVNQVAFLAKVGGFPYWHLQQNRHFGRFAAHSNGLLAKHPVKHIVHHQLPGKLKGRGALQADFVYDDKQLLVLSVHLALGQQARKKQLAYIGELLSQCPYFVLMGDMNCEQAELYNELNKNGLETNYNEQYFPTFPRWKPKYQFDQILVSNNLRIISNQVIDLGVSDHLPIAMEIEIPSKLSEYKNPKTSPIDASLIN
jgi:endonuclease/exonuclease/phosphatase family metal-dependent hydrolase